MAYIHVHRLLTGITSTGQTEDIAMGVRGGILLNLELNWVARSFFNIGTEDELAKGADIYVIVGDSNGSTPILGQRLSPIDYIIVPQGGTWVWSHPYADQLRSAAPVVSKLAPYGSYPVQPIGLIKANMRLIANQDLYRPNIQHDLEVIAEFITFDSAVI